MKYLSNDLGIRILARMNWNLNTTHSIVLARRYSSLKVLNRVNLLLQPLEELEWQELRWQLSCLYSHNQQNLS